MAALSAAIGPAGALQRCGKARPRACDGERAFGAGRARRSARRHGPRKHAETARAPDSCRLSPHRCSGGAWKGRGARCGAARRAPPARLRHISPLFHASPSGSRSACTPLRRCARGCWRAPCCAARACWRRCSGRRLVPGALSFCNTHALLPAATLSGASCGADRAAPWRQRTRNTRRRRGVRLLAAHCSGGRSRSAHARAALGLLHARRAGAARTRALRWLRVDARTQAARVRRAGGAARRRSICARRCCKHNAHVA
jgi:hypothetical protein